MKVAGLDQELIREFLVGLASEELRGLLARPVRAGIE
jgi:hypothetical protein